MFESYFSRILIGFRIDFDRLSRLKVFILIFRFSYLKVISPGFWVFVF